jgi:hypothetical protein
MMHVGAFVLVHVRLEVSRGYDFADGSIGTAAQAHAADGVLDEATKGQVVDVCYKV